MKLPQDFLDKMKNLLNNSEYQEFLASYNSPRYFGLRVNTIKISVEEFLKISPFNLTPIPWTSDGFYYPEGEAPGKHPYYHAGLYYIQEPSAMLPGEVLNAQPGERVLDLCAAPGGKTVKIAAGMKGKGILVANDINAERVKALVKNVELCGIKNAIVTNESPRRLAANFEGYFDRILADVPCSGEGMFRKDENAIKSWGRYKCETCAEMQTDILKYADIMLKPGGYLVYSTCTFSPQENEMIISDFIKKYKNCEILEIPKKAGIDCGRPEWSDGNAELIRTARLWPHKVKGEGHFAALLRKKPRNTPGRTGTISMQIPNDGDLCPFFEFVEENLNTRLEGYFNIRGNSLYLLPEEPPSLRGIKVAKFGWYLGEFSKGKFSPSHSMIISLKAGDLKNSINFASDSREVISYLKGETLMIEGTKGLIGVCVDGYTLGWAKQEGCMLKNLYPKGWRKLS
jgi:NOL1/NOP2/sun family putative RNA methylase